MEVDQVWNEIKRVLSDEPELPFSVDELVKCLKKNTLEAKKEPIAMATFSISETQHPVLAARAKFNHLFSLCMEYYQTKMIKPDTIASWECDIIFPVRGITCVHADVFDYIKFIKDLQAGNNKCPICRKPLQVPSLYLDAKIYKAIISHNTPKTVILGIIPKADCIGYDPEVAVCYTLLEIHKMGVKNPGTIRP
jgi:hypothetical protein